MPIAGLRFTAFCAFLAAWLVFAIGAVAGGIPRIQQRSGAPALVKPLAAIGALLQFASVLTITLRWDGTLRPTPFELGGVALLAPFAAVLFVCALLASRRHAGPNGLVTRGVYAWIRHPIYLAFLGMLVATGLLASAGQGILVAAVIYLAGSELRIASEEDGLARTFPNEYEQYRLRTRWRYFPGLR